MDFLKEGTELGPNKIVFSSQIAFVKPANKLIKLSEANTNNLLILSQIVILKIIFYFPITENCRSQKKSVFNACFKKIVLQKSLQRTVFCFQFNSVFKGNVYLNNNLCFVFKPFRLVGSR